MRNLRSWSLLGALLLFACAGCRLGGEKIVAEVGDFKITQKDVEQRNKVLKVYQPEDKRDLGLEQLVRLMTSAQVLKNNGQKLDHDTLVKESKRIDKATLAPDMLAHIKAIFVDEGKFNEDAYLRVYVLPQYADRVIFYEFFQNDPNMQKDSLDRAHKLMESVRGGSESFDSLAKKEGLKTSAFTVRKSGVDWKLPEAPPLPGMKSPPKAKGGNPNDAAVPMNIREKLTQQNNERESTEGLAWVRVAEQLKPGEIFSQVINMNDTWIVVKLLKKAGSVEKPTYEMAGITVPKSDFGKWFDAEQKKVVIKKDDKKDDKK